MGFNTWNNSTYITTLILPNFIQAILCDSNGCIDKDKVYSHNSHHYNTTHSHSHSIIHLIAKRQSNSLSPFANIRHFCFDFSFG